MAVRPRRLHPWSLASIAAMLCAAAFTLESAGVFPAWQLAVQWTPAALPSTTAVPHEEIRRGVPVLSLAMDPADLHHRRTGLLVNPRQRGDEWERPGSLSYFEDARLRFAAGVGVRIHGGSSRIAAPRQGFRLYFRRRYGAREFAPGVLFGAQAQPIRRLVVHNDARRQRGTTWHFVNPFAYDIARAMGAMAPDTKPVRFFVNGERYGPFVLTERLDEHFFAGRLGHEDVRFDEASYQRFWDWVSATRPLTMRRVAEQVDLDSLTRWFLAVAFCATEDAYQGPNQFLDPTRARGRWFWVAWDMDRSFRDPQRDSYRDLLERVAEARRGRDDWEPRATLVTYLLADDPAYRDFFTRTYADVMDNRVTQAFLEERYRHYADEASRLGVENVDYLKPLREFITHRPAFFRRISEQWLNVPTRAEGRAPESARDQRLPAHVWRRIPRGVFWMGCVPGDTRCRGEEKPRQQVRIDAPFEMMDREVSAADFRTFAAREMPRQPDWYAQPDHPVVNVTWDEAQAYCAAQGGRLPTEEEWEYAARGGLDGRLFPWGDEFRGQANADGTAAADRWIASAPAGSFEPNGFRLHDMAGNVWEWTASLHRAAHDRPRTDAEYELRTIKGGSWDSEPPRLRASARAARSRHGRHNLYIGFRCVRPASARSRPDGRAGLPPSGPTRARPE
jgi:formylglycine-generating enzyme required for sulfatase activity